MKKQLSALALGLLMASANGYSQSNNVQPCNTYAAMEEHFAANPQARANYEAAQKQLLQESSQLKNAAGKSSAAFVYTVPVVFHVLHQGGAENITDAQCIAALAQVNNDYARAGSDVNTIAQPFQNLYINSDIKFMLAHKDPNGNCTSGIEHIYDSRTNWPQAQTSSYNGLTWNPTKYLNIYIVKSIIPSGPVAGGGIIVGYTYKPGTWGTGASQDAIVYNYNYLSGLDARSLSHEIGHWLNLAHTFGNTNNPGVTCGDDNLYDTPPTKGNYGTCGSSLSGNTCAGTTSVYASGQSNVENIMDYSSCPKNFTTDQTNSMRNALASTISNRQNLWSGTNLTATDVNGNGNCAPIADFYSTNNSYTVCSGGSLTFKDFSYNAAVSVYSWTANNSAQVASPSNSITVVTFPNVGTVNVMLTAINPAGNTTKVRTVTVISGSAAISGPSMESFEQNGVPANWSVINADGSSPAWDQTYDAYYDQFASFYMNGAACAPGQVDILETPVIDVASSNDKTFTFAYAYAQKTSTHNDVLKIQGSKDCGGTWIDIATLSASQMQINSGGVAANSFTPFVQAEWKICDVSTYPFWIGFINSPSVKLRFTFIEGTAGYGNNLYIDAVNLFNTGVGINELSKSYRFGLSPNPASGEAVVSFNLHDAANVEVTVVDMMGKVVATAYNGQMTAGEQKVTVNKNASLAQGVYFVNFSVNGTKMSKKLIID
ncbi:MAG: T9SS type A sorting domain-containing protein [Bacteroidia bacterium]|nr:T9SS type A sorting domain-containing protein [Bacteroidia bacterium]